MSSGTPNRPTGPPQPSPHFQMALPSPELVQQYMRLMNPGMNPLMMNPMTPMAMGMQNPFFYQQQEFIRQQNIADMMARVQRQQEQEMQMEHQRQAFERQKQQDKEKAKIQRQMKREREKKEKMEAERLLGELAHKHREQTSQFTSQQALIAQPTHPVAFVNNSQQVVLNGQLNPRIVSPTSSATSTMSPPKPVSPEKRQIVEDLSSQTKKIGVLLDEHKQLIDGKRQRNERIHFTPTTSFPAYDFINRTLTVGIISLVNLDTGFLKDYKKAQDVELEKLRMEINALKIPVNALSAPLFNQSGQYPVNSVQSSAETVQKTRRRKSNKAPATITSAPLSSGTSSSHPSTSSTPAVDPQLQMNFPMNPDLFKAFYSQFLAQSAQHHQVQPAAMPISNAHEFLANILSRTSNDIPIQSPIEAQLQHLRSPTSGLVSSTQVLPPAKPQPVPQQLPLAQIAHKADPVLGSSRNHPIDLESEESERIQRSSHPTNPLLATMLSSSSTSANSTTQDLNKMSTIIKNIPESVITKTACGPVILPSDVSPEQMRRLLTLVVYQFKESDRQRELAEPLTTSDSRLKNAEAKKSTSINDVVAKIKHENEKAEREKKEQQEMLRRKENENRNVWYSYLSNNSATSVPMNPSSESTSEIISDAPVNLVLGESTIPEPSSLSNSGSSSTSASPKRCRKRKPEKRVTFESVMEMEEEVLVVEEEVEENDELMEQDVEMNGEVDEVSEVREEGKNDEVPEKRARMESSENGNSSSSTSCTPFGTSIHQNHDDTVPAQQVSPVGIEKEDDGTHFQENRRNGTLTSSLAFGQSLVPENIEVEKPELSEQIPDAIETSNVVTILATSSEQVVPEVETSTMRDETFKATQSIEEQIPDSFPFADMDDDEPTYASTEDILGRGADSVYGEQELLRDSEDVGGSNEIEGAAEVEENQEEVGDASDSETRQAISFIEKNDISRSTSTDFEPLQPQQVTSRANSADILAEAEKVLMEEDDNDWNDVEDLESPPSENNQFEESMTDTDMTPGSLSTKNAQTNVVGEAYQYQYEDEMADDTEEDVINVPVALQEHHRGIVEEAYQYESLEHVPEEENHVIQEEVLSTRPEREFEVLGDVDVPEEEQVDVEKSEGEEEEDVLEIDEAVDEEAPGTSASADYPIDYDPSVNRVEVQSEEPEELEDAPEAVDLPMPRRPITPERIDAFLEDFAPAAVVEEVVEKDVVEEEVVEEEVAPIMEQRRVQRPPVNPAFLLRQNDLRMENHFVDLLEWVLFLINNPKNSASLTHRNAESFIMLLNSIDPHNLNDEVVEQILARLVELCTIAVRENLMAHQ